MIWDGVPDIPEDESEQESWADPLCGEMPGQPPHTADEPEMWKENPWGTGPEYELYKKQMDEEDGG
jgi:hypothetical protein